MSVFTQWYEMSPKRPDQKDIHVYVDAETYQLLKAIAGIRGKSLNAITTEAIEEWLGSDPQTETIKNYNLDRLIEDQNP